MYLELGLTPIRGVIKASRIHYHHTIVKLKDEEMLFRFFESKWKYPVKNDWVIQVKEDLSAAKQLKIYSS